jgi:hypothetical protein
MRPFGRRPGIQHCALFWIPGSLAQRKIDASINFVARLAPRNDGFRIDARAVQALRARPTGARREGVAITTMHSPSIASPRNSNTNASNTVNPPANH